MEKVRRSRRHPVTFAVAVDSEDRKDRVALARNASTTGLLLGSRSRFSVGERVSLRFRVAHDEQLVETQGFIVRHESDRRAELWRELLAVKFERPLPELEKKLERAAGPAPALPVERKSA